MSETEPYIEIRRRPSRGEFRGKDLRCFAVFVDGQKIGLIAEETIVHRWPHKWKKGVLQTSLSPRWVVLDPKPRLRVERHRTRKAAVAAVVNAHKARQLSVRLVATMTGVTVR